MEEFSQEANITKKARWFKGKHNTEREELDIRKQREMIAQTGYGGNLDLFLFIDSTTIIKTAAATS